MTRRAADPPTAHLDRETVRALAAWDPGGAPVTSLYLNVDGRRFPRKADYLVRLEELVRAARHQAEELDRDARRSVEADLEAMSTYVRERFERDGVRGLALFSCSEAGLWEAFALPRPVRNRAVVGPEPGWRPAPGRRESRFGGRARSADPSPPAVPVPSWLRPISARKRSRSVSRKRRSPRWLIR